MTKWKEFGVLTLEEIKKYSEVEEGEGFTFGEKKIDGHWKYIGQIKGGSAHGLGRMEGSGGVYEGQFRKHMRYGYGRGIWANGSYCIGMKKENYRDGYNKQVDKDGTVREGNWKLDVFTPAAPVQKGD